MAELTPSANELLEAWPVLSDPERSEGFAMLSRVDAETVFDSIEALDQAELLLAMPSSEQRIWMRLLAPDDAADVLQAVPEEHRPGLLALLDETTRKEVTALLAYAEDDAGGLMSPRFARLRPEMSADESIAYLRRQTRERVENIYYGYVLNSSQNLLGVVSLRELVTAAPDKKVRDLMRTDLVTVGEETDQEVLSNLFAEHDLSMIPVVDVDGRMKGVVTVDDIVDVVREEATEDIQKVGGMSALDAPYLQVSLTEMMRKRIVWLIVLFVGGTFTASALSYFQGQLGKAIFLSLFIPLIVSSGGNSGSQACTLVIRAMALDEFRLRDWWRILRREATVGLMLGAGLGCVGIAHVFVWDAVTRLLGEPIFGPHRLMLAITVALSVLGVVLWGTVVGSMLPFALRRVGLDPASASAPFVSTFVDVTGIVIYFLIALSLFSGTVL